MPDRAIALRDSGTEEHTRRVTDMTLTLACGMGVPAAEMVHICRSAMLHDIGKIGIPDHILRKCASLTEMEQDIMRMHPIYAYELLSVVPALHSADVVTLTSRVHGTHSAPLDLSFLNLPVLFPSGQPV